MTLSQLLVLGHLKWRTYRSSTWNNSSRWSTLKEAAYNYWKRTHWKEQLSKQKAWDLHTVTIYICFVWWLHSKKYMKIIKDKSTWRTLTTANFPSDLHIKYNKNTKTQRGSTLGIIRITYLPVWLSWNSFTPSQISSMDKFPIKEC